MSDIEISDSEDDSDIDEKSESGDCTELGLEHVEEILVIVSEVSDFDDF